MVYTVDLLGDANLRVRDLTITRNTYLANVVVDASADLNSVTTVGNSTTNSIEITSAQSSTSKLTGALKVTGGVGVQGNVHVGSNLFVESNLEVGTANLFVDATSGNVGIGTPDPDVNLHVMGAIKTQNNGTWVPQIQFSSGTNNTNGWLVRANVSDSYAGYFTIDRQDNSVTPNKFVIKNNGYIGIGTADPGVYKLDVLGGTVRTRTSLTGGGFIELGGTETNPATRTENVIYGATTYINLSGSTARYGRNMRVQPGQMYGGAMWATAGYGEPHLYGADNVIYGGDINAGGNDGTGAGQYYAGNTYIGAGIAWAGGTNGNSARTYNGNIYFQTGTNDTTSSTDMNRYTRMSINTSGNVGIGTNNAKAVTHVGKLSANSGTFNDIPQSNMGISATFPDSTRLWLANRLEATGEDYWGMALGTKYTGDIYIQSVNKASSAIYNLLLQPNGGNVGIGTATPYAKFHVTGASGDFETGGSGSSASFFIFNTDLYTNTTGDFGTVSIYGNNDIISGGWVGSLNGSISASDTRIKKNIVDADDSECLEVLRLLKPKKYQYKDEINRGQEPVWGFIAQEVRGTLPYATQLRKDVLPNIYELANVSQSNVITFTNFNTSDLESNATTLIRTKGIDGQDHDIHLAEVIDDHTIRVEEDLSAWTGSVDETGNVITEIMTTTLTPEEYETLEDKSGYVANITGYQNANVVVSIEEYSALEDTTGYEEIVQDYTKTTTTYPGTQLFVYGQEVDDFVFLKKEAIWTVATAALQEVDRQQQADKARIAELETQLASVLARLDALEGA